jgi:hypothetical protein
MFHAIVMVCLINSDTCAMFAGSEPFSDIKACEKRMEEAVAPSLTAFEAIMPGANRHIVFCGDPAALELPSTAA